MTCRKVRKLIPLIAGDDLRPRLARAVRAHLDACPGCRAELEGFRAALAEAKAAARAESVPEWGGGEWNALMARVAAEAKGTGKIAGRRRHACPEAELGRGFCPRRRDRAGRSLRPFKRPVAAAGGVAGRKRPGHRVGKPPAGQGLHHHGLSGDRAPSRLVPRQEFRLQRRTGMKKTVIALLALAFTLAVAGPVFAEDPAAVPRTGAAGRSEEPAPGDRQAQIRSG